MNLAPDEIDALKSLGRYRLDRGTAEFFALRKEGAYSFPESKRVPGLSPDTLQRLVDAGLVQVEVAGQGGDLVTLTVAGAKLADELLVGE
ncbi:MAG TPA: hypothetical protein VGM77_06870 [Gemmatimonadales bacterium]